MNKRNVKKEKLGNIILQNRKIYCKVMIKTVRY